MHPATVGSIERSETADAAVFAAPPDGNRPCPLCGRPTGRMLRTVYSAKGSAGRWSLVQCPDCEMVYLGERLSYEVQAAQHDWPRSRRREAERRDREQPVSRAAGRLVGLLKRWRKPKARMVRMVLRHVRTGRVCDLGCGTGRLLKELARTFDVAGVEISASSADAARRLVPHAEIVVGPVAAGLPPGDFDVVTMSSYLEHEQEPRAVLSLVHSALRPGGVLVVKVPNYGCWNRRPGRPTLVWIPFSRPLQLFHCDDARPPLPQYRVRSLPGSGATGFPPPTISTPPPRAVGAC